MMDDPKNLVSTRWLAERLHDPNLRVLDASWVVSAQEADLRAAYAQEHIPHAQFFSLKQFSDETASLPNTMPPVDKLISGLRKLGIGDRHQVVIYDSAGLFSAARVWWMFQCIGFRYAAVLDGGLPKWRSEGHPLESKSTSLRDQHLSANFQPHLISDVAQVAEASKVGSHEIIDARASSRFRGDDGEPRAGMRAGHIPNSKNVPYSQVLNPDKTMKSPEELRAVFEDAGVDLSKPAITTCGSGVTAAILTLALARLGKQDHSLYDGSWSEWGQFSILDIANGET